MTPTETAMQYAGIHLAELERVTGESRQTLINWHRAQPKRFKLICSGVQFEREALAEHRREEYEAGEL